MYNKHSILSLSLLSILAVLAINASAASASWQYLKSGSTVSSFSLTGTYLLGLFLVPGLKLTIHCPEGAGSGTASAGGFMSVRVKFSGCKAEGPQCTIEDIFGLVGVIRFEAVGSLQMFTGDNENIWSSFFGGAIATVFMSGPKCTMPEEATISGNGRLTILEALKDLKQHLAHLDDEGLHYGNEPMTIDGAGGAGAILAHLEETFGGTYAIHLTGL